jgi:putative spermidine/putrescine transport system ATP-binding protein
MTTKDHSTTTTPGQKAKRGKVTIKNVSKRFGDFDALHPLTLDIAAGQYCTLLGPSGCGKTTLLRMIAGHETPTQGDLAIDNRSIVNLKTSDRGTAMMFQNYALFPHLSVLDNVAFALKMRGQDADTRYATAKRLLEKVGLEQFASRLPSQLSGGQQQRVALARALITDPTVLLLDEPLSALDEFLRIRMRGELRRIQQDLGITFIHVTHNQLEAIGVSDMVVVMDKGRIEQAASPSDIYNKPSNTHVARFIGGQNVMDGHCTTTKSARIHARNEASRCEFVVPSNSDAKPGDVVKASVRKDRVELLPISANAPKDKNSFKSKIDSIEYQGSYVTASLVSPFEHEFIATVPDHVFASRGFRIDDPVLAVFDPNETVLISDKQ